MSATATTEPAKSPAASAPMDADGYHAWAQSLVGKDWEIFWVEEEDNEGNDANMAATVEEPTLQVDHLLQQDTNPQADLEVSGAAHSDSLATASGQETAEEKKIGPLESEAFIAANDIPQTGDADVPQEEQAVAEPDPRNMSVDQDLNHDKNSDVDEEEDDEGSIIDDWYDGHVLKVERTTPTSGSGIESSYVFHVHFVGDETIYKVSLVPSKVRPSARGWVQRTVALLRPPHPASEDENYDDALSWETKLPPDTRRLEDEGSLKELETDICVSPRRQSFSGTSSGETNENEDFSPPSFNDLYRMRRLQYFLEAQILLRGKLAKIESRHGEDKFTDGVRNPTEPYVNHLVQCCRDLIQACEWYCKAWKLMNRFFGNDAQDDFESLTFDGLVRDFMDFGRDTLVNSVLIDVNSCTSPGKRRQAIPSAVTSSGRRTKRRRLQSSSASLWSGGDESQDILFVASHLERDILSTNLAESFAIAVEGGSQCWHRRKLGEMFCGLALHVLNPLASWKSDAALILGSNDHSSLLGSLDSKTTLMKNKVSKRKFSSTESKRDDMDVCLIEGHAIDDDDASSSDESSAVVFSYEDVQACTAAIRSNRVLARFNLFDEVHGLHGLLRDIEQIEIRARDLFERLVDETTTFDHTSDEILVDLKGILHEISSPTSPLSRIDPICKNGSKNVPEITRDDLADAVELRKWFVDVWRAQSHRERLSFLQTLLEKMEKGSVPIPVEGGCLALNRGIVSLRERTAQGVKELHARVQNYANLAEKWENDLLASTPEHGRSIDSLAICQHLQSALAELADVPVVLAVEEKIACRIDVIRWREEAKNAVVKLESQDLKCISFDEIKALYETLDSLVRGTSPSIFKLTQTVTPNDDVDNEIRDFVMTEIDRTCGDSASTVRNLYEASRSWKVRAESVLSCLSAHGNAAAGRWHATPQKMTAMVDIKRIDDLVVEYAQSRVSIPGYEKHLSDILAEAHQWTRNLELTLLRDGISFSDALAFVDTERESRPKGLIMNPTRSVVDSLFDMLSWYQMIVNVFEEIREKIRSFSSADASTVAGLFSSIIKEEVYPLLADGSEILEAYCNASFGVESKFRGKSDISLQMLESMFNIRRSVRAISQERIQSSFLIQSLISRMISRDDVEGCPLRFMIWFQWHLLVAEFVSHFDGSEISGLSRTRVDSLDTAKELLAMQPLIALQPDSTYANFSCLTSSKSVELVEFDKIIVEAERIEDDARAMLSKSRDLLRGSFEKSEDARIHLSQLKECHGIFKARSVGEGGVSLSVVLEQQLDQNIKIFGWLLKTFSYPVLHQAESSVLFNDERTNPECLDQRIPWDALVAIYDRIPKDVNGSGDFLLCTFTVTELYKAASKWNNEISQSTLLSNRGNKRRSGKAQNSECLESSQVDTEGDSSAKIEIARIELLARDPILEKVQMPRQKALHTMLRNSRQFESQLHSFLAQDYHGTDLDKAPFPRGDSLMGTDGQFILYRLTLSPLFGIMQSSMNALSQIGDNVFAEMPGKAAFDWMSSAVNWIERLHYAATIDSQSGYSKNKMLVIPFKEARSLCSLGEDIFLQTTEDMRQTLSNHGIFVSTSVQKKKLTVTLKKDGAHHSIGGTVIRWCPILFDALRADTGKTEAWETTARNLSRDFSSFCDHRDERDEKSLFQLFRCREKARKMFDKGRDSLVVLPNKDLIDSLSSILGNIQTIFDSQSDKTLVGKFSIQLYTNSTDVHDERFGHLDALMYRRTTASIDNGDEMVQTNDPSPFDSTPTFRDTCRANLKNAFIKAVEKLSLDLIDGNSTESLCALRAWEIENEMFAKFQGDIGTSRVSPEYREKARSLKSNLTIKNLSLCLRILTGKVDSSSLVKMSSDQLASQQAKLDREKARREALRDTVLTPGVEEEPSAEVQFRKGKSTPPSPDKRPPPSILKASRQAPAPESQPQKLNADVENPSAIKAPTVAKNDKSDDDADGAPTMDEYLSDDDGIPTLDAATLPDDDSSGRIAKSSLKRPPVSSYSPRPPPPPSLAMSKAFQSSTESEESKNAGRGIRIGNFSGGDKFRLELQGGTSKLTFHAAFYQENSSLDTLSQYMPEMLVQKGRSKIDDFKRFLADKLKGGKWQATCLRLATISDRDASIYKAYYKEFEMKERIAMFKLGGDPGSKLFLVTPKFHSQITATGLVSFLQPTSTYGIALTKDPAPVWLD
jgi:Transcription factor S-II (TFIIS), central domain